MVDKIAEAAETKMANKIVMGAAGVFASVVVILLAAICVGAWNSSIAQALLAEKVTGLTEDMAGLKADLATSTARRYTSDDASRDRATVFDTINQRTTDTTARLNGIDARDTAQDARIAELMEFKVRSEERERMGNKQP